jgi:hypothetical protein
MLTRFTQIVCQHAKTHAIVDATAPGDTQGWGSGYRELLNLDCKGVNLKEIPGGNDLWNPQNMSAARVLVIAPTKLIESVGVHPPSGYVASKIWNDTSMNWPAPFPVTLIDLAQIENPA